MMRLKKRLLFVPPTGAGPGSRPGEAEEELARFDPGVREDWWWRQPKWSRREWRLEVGTRLAALMKGEGVFSRTSRVRFAGAEFELRRTWRGHIQVRTGGAAEPVTRLVSSWRGGGHVVTPAGDRLHMVPIGFWRRAFELRTEDDLMLVRFESHEGIARHEVQVLLEDPARRRDDLRLLLALAAAVVFEPRRHSG